jgi:hypothetical protein
MKSFFQGFLLVGIMILSPIFGCLLSGLWAEGGNTFWKRIDYFPLPAEKLDSMQPSVNEFWVEANGGTTYHIRYPCERNQQCWDETNNIAIIEEYTGFYEVSYNQCENDSFVYPLFHKIKMCITSTVLAPDAYYRASLALTSDGDLWIWEKPMIDPFSVMIQMIVCTVIGGVVGVIAAIFLALRIR